MPRPKDVPQPVDAGVIYSLYREGAKPLYQLGTPRKAIRETFAAVLPHLTAGEKAQLALKSLSSLQAPNLDGNVPDFQIDTAINIDVLDGIACSLAAQPVTSAEKPNASHNQVIESLLKGYVSAVNEHEADLDGITLPLIDAGIALAPAFIWSGSTRKQKAARREEVYTAWRQRIPTLPFPDRGPVSERTPKLIAAFGTIPPPSFS